MVALVVFFAAVLAAYFCYSRLNGLSAMQGEPVTHTEAVVTRVDTPMIKKNQSPTEVESQVTLMFAAGDASHQVGYAQRGAVPEVGAKEPIVYLTSNPTVFLREAEYAELPKQLMALRVLMWVFAAVALATPIFITMNKN